MIIFHAKLDGTVTTTPGFVPMSSALADLVVVSDFDYAICTIKLEPSSGIQIPDIVCNFVLSSETGATVWTAPLPPEATVLHGSVGYQLIFSAADGMKQSTLEGAFDVPKGVITNMPANVGDLSSKTVADLYTLLATIYGIYKDLDDSVENQTNSIMSLTTKIGENSTGIAQNTGNIRRNSEAIANVAEEVTKNAGDIETAKKDIQFLSEKLTSEKPTIDVVSLPTSDIDTEATYRVLYGTFVLGKMLRNDSTCHMVEWDSVPTEPGESVINDNNGSFSYVGYYNVKDNTVYGYFGTETIEFLLDWVDTSDLNYIVKLLLKSYLKNMTAGWKTMQEIVSAVGSAMSITWGGVIPSTKAAADVNALYLYLSSETFCYKNGVWIGRNAGVGMPGTGIGAVVFNHPDNIASGTASLVGGQGNQVIGDNALGEGYGNIITGDNAHGEGDGNEVAGKNAHGEGEKNKAPGQNAHAQGCLTEANGPHSSTEGYKTKTEEKASASHAGGIGTIANADAQTVVGRYNEADATKAFIVGNGTSEYQRRNAMAVDWNGNVEFSGIVTSIGKTLATEDFVRNCVNEAIAKLLNNG